MFIKSKKGQVEFYWRIVLLIIALALLFWGLLYLTKTGNIMTSAIKSFFGLFK